MPGRMRKLFSRQGSSRRTHRGSLTRRGYRRQGRIGGRSPLLLHRMVTRNHQPTGTHLDAVARTRGIPGPLGPLGPTHRGGNLMHRGPTPSIIVAEGEPHGAAGFHRAVEDLPFSYLPRNRSLPLPASLLPNALAAPPGTAASPAAVHSRLLNTGILFRLPLPSPENPRSFRVNVLSFRSGAFLQGR
jgi:hypothetical protein